MSKIPERIFVSFEHPSGKYIGLEKRKMYVASELKLLPTDIEYIRAPQWVSVNDRLPKSMVLVLAHHINGSYSLCRNFSPHRFVNEEPAVTHWQPLLAPPKA